MILLFLSRLCRYGIISVPVLLFSLLNIQALHADPASDELEKEKYITELIKKADNDHIWESPEWMALLHYKKNLFGIESFVDDPGFFLSKDGKCNPREELYATIRAMLNNNPDNQSDQLYKYTARYSFLKDKLAIDERRVPHDYNEKFDKFYADLKPTAITLVFPAGFMNSPASMYGHTFLMIESGKENKLLAQTANYAAITDETFGPVFAFKGLFGLYHGYFSYLPYYKKIKEYNDGEMRDMWEYELNMTPEEIKTTVRHVVELEDIYSEYYFIDENCSFNLLYLIEAAKPETHLTDSFGIGVEPIDTLRLVKEKKLVLKRTYRPSLYSKIKYLKSKLTDKEISFVLDVCNGERSISEIDGLNLSDERKTIICDLCNDYLKFMAIKNNISESDYRTRFMAVLQCSNLLPGIDNYRDIPEPIPPEETHGSRRITAGSGYGSDGLYSDISYRQTCHELMDPDEGFIQNSQIVFLNLSARYYYDMEKFQIQNFDLINLLSLPVSDSFYTSPCYEFKTGLIQNNWNDDWILSYRLEGASGLSFLIAKDVQVYLLAGPDTYFADEFENNVDFQLGAQSGIITTLGPWKNHLFGKVYKSFFGTDHLLLHAGASERITINRYSSVIAEGAWSKNFNKSFFETSLKFCLYY